MHIYTGTELGLPRSLWHFHPCSAWCYLLIVIIVFHILHLVQCTLREKREIINFNIHSGFINIFK